MTPPPTPLEYAAFHPPIGVAASVRERLDPFVGRLTTAGPAFVPIEARRPALDTRPAISSNTQQSI
jgi:hypothetical protein